MLHDGNAIEIVRRRGRSGGPLESGGAPRVVARRGPLSKAIEDIDDQQRKADSEHECTDCGEQVQPVPTHVRGISIDPPGHAYQAKDVHREEGEIEPDERNPKIPVAELLAEHPAAYFWEPIVEGANQ